MSNLHCVIERFRGVTPRLGITMDIHKRIQEAWIWHWTHLLSCNKGTWATFEDEIKVLRDMFTDTFPQTPIQMFRLNTIQMFRLILFLNQVSMKAKGRKMRNNWKSDCQLQMVTRSDISVLLSGSNLSWYYPGLTWTHFIQNSRCIT